MIELVQFAEIIALLSHHTIKLHSDACTCEFCTVSLRVLYPLHIYSEILSLSDGGIVALDWVDKIDGVQSSVGDDPNTPVMLIMAGITGTCTHVHMHVNCNCTLHCMYNTGRLYYRHNLYKQVRPSAALALLHTEPRPSLMAGLSVYVCSALLFTIQCWRSLVPQLESEDVVTCCIAS